MTARTNLFRALAMGVPSKGRVGSMPMEARVALLAATSPLQLY